MRFDAEQAELQKQREEKWKRQAEERHREDNEKSVQRFKS
tara:strand:- start:140382 stop:140501 length:120 start_codon:yes stop_codon:yes gene_type:complete